MPEKLPPLSPEDYKETKKLYADYRLNQSNLLDKNILVISASSLAAMIAFSEKIRPLSEANYLPLLIASIALFGLATASTLTSFYTGYRAACSFDEQLDANHQAGFSCTLISKWDNWTDPLNKISYLAFIIGLICALSYVSINIYQQRSSAVSEERYINTVYPNDGDGRSSHGAKIPQPHASTPSESETPQQPQQSDQQQEQK